MDVTKQAQEGYEGGSSPFALSSPSDMAWRAGGWCYHAMIGAPISARTGRGYKLHVETRTAKVTLDFSADSKYPQQVQS